MTEPAEYPARTSLLQDAALKHQLKQICFWTGWLRFAGYIFIIAWILVGTLYIPDIFRAGPVYDGFFYSIIFLILLGIGSYPVLMIHAFYRKLKTYLNDSEPENFVEGMTYLKQFFRFFGLLIMAIFLFYLVLFIVARIIHILHL